MLMTKILILSTNETPDTAASPTPEIITVSTIPTKIAKNCSNTNGRINFFKSLLEYSILSHIFLLYFTKLYLFPVSGYICYCSTIYGKCKLFFTYNYLSVADCIRIPHCKEFPDAHKSVPYPRII